MIPADLAYRCLQSIPFHRGDSLRLLDSITPFLDWQTTLARLKYPPQEYADKIQPPYDFYQIWRNIRVRAWRGGFRNQYDFGAAVYFAFQKAHDGHFGYSPKEFAGIFGFGRSTPLVSFSLDGLSPPKPYLFSDILAFVLNNGTFTPSAIATIDQQPAIRHLEDWSSHGTLQDRDALYNNLFYVPAQVALGEDGTGAGTFAGGGRGRWIYPGPQTRFEFENGTHLVVQNYARPLVSFEGIQTGADLYRKYLSIDRSKLQNVFQLASGADAATTPPATPTVTPSETLKPAPGYPPAMFRHSQNFNSGYFLQGAGYEDLVVIAAPSFVDGNGAQEFQNVIKQTIAAAMANRKTKLIIDLSGNAGGTVILGYDFFTQLFPNLLPFGGARFRAHEALNLLGAAASQLVAGVPRRLGLKPTVLNLLSGPWNYRSDSSIYNAPFRSWPEKFGPYQVGPLREKFTATIRWNLSDPVLPWMDGGVNVTGYPNKPPYTNPPFSSENIVMVYDGYCASTCTIFSELMRQQARVRTIALGGRSNTNIIQAVGGTKGSNNYAWGFILFQLLVPVYKGAPPMIKKLWQRSSIARYNQLFSFRGGSFMANVRDAMRQGDKTNTPLQFLYEPADCRVLYTPAMLIDQSVVWRTVADTAWGNKAACVAVDNSNRGRSFSHATHDTTTSSFSNETRAEISDNIKLQSILDSFSIETKDRKHSSGYMPA
ncbi:hypothetical protein K461DRAFT_326546 [Myriangium duriaei CBS 260.36]|uniref:CPAF-like PDZ domain-containing protein n=1 Tax=Myriangium duriaei CBS 260.36 TaxID=1168546 RepID=A0A9P4J6L6_9PEZI|nr:hypothetical protein K461DRAFT_326546 [Myriangium duriaei CBS 260.36]